MSEEKKTNCNIDSYLKERARDSGDNHIFSRRQTALQKQTVLLHSCCGPCSTSVIQRLMMDFSVTIFFYNPNITDEIEYNRRKEAQIQFLNQFNETLPWEEKIGFIEGDYDRERFYEIAKGRENLPEGGARCGECFKLRLETAAQMARLRGYNNFSTTLSVSPHKDYDTITAIGKNLALIYGIGYLDMDFKKKAGFQISMEMSKEYKIYRQNYCGCEFSMNK